MTSKGNVVSNQVQFSLITLFLASTSTSLCALLSPNFQVSKTKANKIKKKLWDELGVVI